MPLGDIPQFVWDAALAVVPVGSCVTCNPPVMNTDEDWLVLLREGRDILVELADSGFDLGGSDIRDNENRLPGEARFKSFARGSLNLIITSNSIFFMRFCAATSVAKRLNLLDKNDRIALFQAVLYGNSCEDKIDV